METVKLNIEYDLLLQKAKLSSNTIEKENSTIVQSVNHIYFVICNSGFWCASYFSIDNMESSSQVLRCHLCDSYNTELIPISSNESHRGMQMEFYRSNDIVDKQKPQNNK